MEELCCGCDCTENEKRILMDFTIIDPYGNMSHVCKEQELFEGFDGDGLEAYCEAFRLLLVQLGYIHVEGKRIEFVERD